MRESTYEMICALLLGIGSMCLFMGYDTHVTIVEPLLSSAPNSAPNPEYVHAGFYGAGLSAAFFMFASLLTPFVLGWIGSKKTLLLGSLLFTIHLGSFLFADSIPYYSTAAVIGVGYALFFAGHAGYITEHSTKESIGSNSAFTWALAMSSAIVSGFVLAATSHPPVTSAATEVQLVQHDEIVSAQLSGNTTTTSFRFYSDADERSVYVAFFSICLFGNLIFWLIPDQTVASSISERFGKKSIGFVAETKKLLRTLGDTRTLQLVPLFCFLGFTTCFWVTAYPTTLFFSASLANRTLLPAVYLMAVGAGEIIMGAIICAVSKRISNFAQFPSLCIGAIVFLLSLSLSLLSTPPAATLSPTSARTPLLEPRLVFGSIELLVHP